MIKSLLPRLAALTLGLSLAHDLAAAEDWGAYGIVPVSAPAMLLEAVDGGTTDGTVVSINKPAGTAHQKWMIEPKEEGFAAIKPSHRSTLVLSAARGGAKNGTGIVPETDRDDPWQRWAMTRQVNGSYTLTPKHAPALGLDDFGGKAEPGARIDLWAARSDDPHLQWFIRPLAGSPVKEAAASGAEPVGPRYQPPPIRPEDIRPGVTKQSRFAQSRIFPGTVRDVMVFHPGAV
jgi:hypothetical protein